MKDIFFERHPLVEKSPIATGCIHIGKSLFIFLFMFDNYLHQTEDTRFDILYIKSTAFNVIYIYR